VTTDAATTQIAWNAAARADAIAEFGVLTAVEIQRAAAATESDAIDRMIGDGCVFAVEGPDGPLFPAFQFADGEPRAAIAKVLKALAGELRSWEILAWFTGSSGFLDGARPVDLLSDAPDDVVAAAAYQASLSED
jgi:hypothetical protein